MQRIALAHSLPAVVSLIVAGSAWSGCGGQSAAPTRSASTGTPVESSALHTRCPPRDARIKASPDARTAQMLVPLAPSGALICRYWGLDDRERRPAGLAGTVAVKDPGVLSRLVARLDALPPVPGPPAPSCPASSGRSEVIFFHYSGAPDDPVRVEAQGCAPVTNGRLERWGISLPSGRHWRDEALI